MEEYISWRAGRRTAKLLEIRIGFGFLGFTTRIEWLWRFLDCFPGLDFLGSWGQWITFLTCFRRAWIGSEIYVLKELEKLPGEIGWKRSSTVAVLCSIK
jgi:hypothetical protein